MHITKLHDQPDLLPGAVTLLNSHWKKNDEARVEQLSQSNDDLPINFVGFTECKILARTKS
jgi:hypothetical protein